MLEMKDKRHPGELPRSAVQVIPSFFSRARRWKQPVACWITNSAKIRERELATVGVNHGDPRSFMTGRLGRRGRSAAANSGER